MECVFVLEVSGAETRLNAVLDSHCQAARYAGLSNSCCLLLAFGEDDNLVVDPLSFRLGMSIVVVAFCLYFLFVTSWETTSARYSTQYSCALYKSCVDSALLVFSFRPFGGDDECGVIPPSLMRRV